ncbi:unnamed protein product [Musa acuminata subsp. malaccensis]|uniref:(wild Malaysian banana) hypothetical protein n=1 Tax=Musa acuminata subsp. malaccensis TaxID=214687 RepID=A0A8D7EXB6_MUSAM|nr:unnamed protein product [Musa acuminata subsp. malaccensis]
MMLQKRLDYGFSGCQVPAMLYFPKSAKVVSRKRSARRKVENKQLCAIDLLATVAGELLSERENCAPSPQCIDGASGTTNTSKASVKPDHLCQKEPLKTEPFDQHSCNDTVLGPEVATKRQISCGSTEHLHILRPKDSGPASLLDKYDILDAIARESKTLNNRVDISYSAAYAVAGRCGTETNLPASPEVEGDGLTGFQESENQMPGNGLDINAVGIYGMEDSMDLDTKPPALVSSDSSTEVPVCWNYLPSNSSLPKQESGMEHVVDRDDDDNSSGCTHLSTITNKACRPRCIGNHRVRKLSTLKYWRAAPNILKYSHISDYDTEKKRSLHGKKIYYTRQRTQRSYCKRRKLFERCLVSASNGGMYSGDIPNLCEMGGIGTEAHDPRTAVLDTYDASPSQAEQSSSYNSVKLRIKSFMVPELFIEIPETATVGSLKQTVMEAVTAFLQGGMSIGVLLQGKKVRDDNKTLRQTGISCSDKLDNLGFTLEPSLTQTPPPLTSLRGPHFLCLDDAVEPLARIPPGALSIDQEATDSTPQAVLTSSPVSDHEPIHSPTDASSLDQTPADKLALVALPPVSIEALAVVPLRKPRHPEHVQRRIRRPFSVAEVEALVQAVEKLGTGRWRDVKLRAFDSAKHRTYVDLKDKWKTLVHTARISPQQRRGEPVPQELLDRVLSAQAFWSQQQSKLHAKPPAAEPCLLL